MGEKVRLGVLDGTGGFTAVTQLFNRSWQKSIRKRRMKMKMVKRVSVLVAFAMIFSVLFTAFPFAEEAADNFRFVRFTATGNDPFGTFNFSEAGNNTTIDPDNVKWAAIHYKTGSQYDSTGAEYTAQLYIVPLFEPCIPVKYEFSGNWETVVVDLTSVSEITELESKWNSTSYTMTDCIRFDPLEPDRDPENTDNDSISGQVNADDYIDVAWIAFFEKEEDANAYTGKENTPYCILDTGSFMNVNGATNLTVELYDQNGKVSQADSGVPVKYVVSPRQMDPQQFTVHKSAAVEFNVPSGKSFKSFILSSAPTWGGQANASLDAVIYAWNHDYDTTIKGKELGRFHEENHADNFDLEMDFGVILPPGRYVIYMTAENDTIGAYGGNMEDIDFDAVFYFDDVESWAWFPYSEIKLLNGTDSAIEVPTPEPTAEPTAKPSAEPTAGSTDKGETDAPATEDGKSDPEGTPTGDNEETAGGDGKKGMPAGAIAGIAAAAAVAVTVILKKKKA